MSWTSMGQSCSLYVGCRCDLVLRAAGRQTRPLIIPRHAAPGGAFSHAPPGSAGAPAAAPGRTRGPARSARRPDALHGGGQHVRADPRVQLAEIARKLIAHRIIL